VTLKVERTSRPVSSKVIVEGPWFGLDPTYVTSQFPGIERTVSPSAGEVSDAGASQLDMTKRSVAPRLFNLTGRR